MIYVNRIMTGCSGWVEELHGVVPSPLRQWHVLVYLVLASLMSTLACQRHVSLSRPESGALGLNRAEWEQARGPAVSQDSAYVRYRLDDADIFLNFTRVSGATDIWVKYSTSDGVPLESARGFVKALIPVDSMLNRTYSPLEGGTVDSFVSESLKRLVEDWEGEPSGSFTVWYSLRDGLVSGFSIRTGKGPPAS